MQESRANNPTDWHEPITVPTPQMVVDSPDLFVDLSGKIYLVDTIPVIEDRGVYMTQSEDDDRTWSDPVQVF